MTHEPEKPWPGLQRVFEHGLPGYPPPRPAEEMTPKRIAISAMRSANRRAYFARIREQAPSDFGDA